MSINKKANLWKGISAGLVSGLVASWVMNRFQSTWTMATEGFEKPHGAQSMQPSIGERNAEPHHENKENLDDATVRTAKLISEKVLGQELKERDKRIAGAAVHYAFGIAMGGFYGAVAEYVPKVADPYGLSFGALFWLVADEIAVPMAGLSKGPTAYRLSTHVYSFASHLVYGLTAELTRRTLRA